MRSDQREQGGADKELGSLDPSGDPRRLPEPRGLYARYGKRVLDITISGIALVMLTPFLAILALGARLASPGPAIFRQRRVGRDGAIFVFFKFRSMPVDIGDIESSALGEVKLTPFGRFIRRTSLDELPQLFNILIGDMSIVGPRPPIESQQSLIQLRAENGAIACRPGLTGLTQINGYDGMAVPDKAAFDGKYAQHITFLGDVLIVMKTFSYVLKPPPKY